MHITVTIPFGLGEAYVTGDFIPYCPGKHYLSNGDPQTTIEKFKGKYEIK